MNNNLGLIELMLVLLAVMGWAAYEWRSVRRDPKKKAGKKRPGGDPP